MLCVPLLQARESNKKKVTRELTSLAHPRHPSASETATSDNEGCERN